MATAALAHGIGRPGWTGPRRFLELGPKNEKKERVPPLLEKEPSVPGENELRYWFCNQYYQTETNVTAYNTG